MRHALLALLVTTGCYDPSAATGVPCGPGGACPSDQQCVDGICDGGEGISDADIEPDGPPLVDAAIDAPANLCAGGDDTCLVSCVDMDPDCETTCGDDRCVGNAGELCGNCREDCAVRAVVCGNGHCQMGESPDCYADCGPTPWLWTAQEEELARLINTARTTGFACAAGPPVTRPAFEVVTDMLPGARDWVWEMSYQDVAPGPNSVGCNGRTSDEREQDGGFSGWLWARQWNTVEAAFDSWMSDPDTCPIVMTANSSRISIAVSLEGTRSYIMVLE